MMSLNRPEPPGPASVASLLAMDRTTLTAALKPLRRRGLVEVTVAPNDRRGRLLTLTPTGRRLLSSAGPVSRQAHSAHEDLLAGADPGRMLRPEEPRVGQAYVSTCTSLGWPDP